MSGIPAYEREPLRRGLRSCRQGDDVQPEHRVHMAAVYREAIREAEAHDFSIFEQAAAAMTIRLYARSLASEDAITVARSLGEVVRALRALKLLGTTNRLRGGISVFSAPQGVPSKDSAG